MRTNVDIEIENRMRSGYRKRYPNAPDLPVSDFRAFMFAARVLKMDPLVYTFVEIDDALRLARRKYTH